MKGMAGAWTVSGSWHPFSMTIEKNVLRIDLSSTYHELAQAVMRKTDDGFPQRFAIVWQDVCQQCGFAFNNLAGMPAPLFDPKSGLHYVQVPRGKLTLNTVDAPKQFISECSSQQALVALIQTFLEWASILSLVAKEL